MEQKLKKSVSSWEGDDSLLFTTLKDNDESWQRISDQEIWEPRSKTMNGRESSISNDFDIVSLNDKNNNSTSDPSSSSSNKSSIKVSKDKNGNEIVEIELNESFAIPSDNKNLFSPVRKLLIIGLK